ncbi:MAG: hypothetical protein HZT40_18260 [Candidatus Thiothrix singaporensis]|uniref:Uncharacterized protein n=1 Tax=Candidatus Thiothrix singaporensis TaxID=2799669 RepID=A0A7L6AVK6_9GAMM|nr:MAG: hypothetical protein HZT40_18260 [Candidatus Thiothrix singaporensis]
MSKYTVYTLRTLAAASSAASAVAASPAVLHLAGAVAGSLGLVCSSAITLAGWHIASTETNTDKRLIAGAVALAFAGAMAAGIHASGDLQTAQDATGAAQQADRLYQQQESSRMAALSAVTAELRATQKSKYPGEYAALQKQVDKLSTPSPRQATASQVTQGLADTGGVYRWAMAGMYEVFAPVLLLLAGMFSRRGHAGHATETTGHAHGHDVDTLPATQNLKASAGAGSTLATLPATLATDVDTDENDADTEGETYRYADPWKTALAGIRGRRVDTTEAGNVTRQAVMDYANCNKQDAVYAMGVSVQEGHLEKSGEGRNARYTYPEQALRAVK